MNFPELWTRIQKNCISTNYVLKLNIICKIEVHSDISNCMNIRETTKYIYILTEKKRYLVMPKYRPI